MRRTAQTCRERIGKKTVGAAFCSADFMLEYCGQGMPELFSVYCRCRVDFVVQFSLQHCAPIWQRTTFGRCI